jgi:hypothetical protein
MTQRYAISGREQFYSRLLLLVARTTRNKGLKVMATPEVTRDLATKEAGVSSQLVKGLHPRRASPCFLKKATSTAWVPTAQRMGLKEREAKWLRWEGLLEASSLTSPNITKSRMGDRLRKTPSTSRKLAKANPEQPTSEKVSWVIPSFTLVKRQCLFRASDLVR